MANRVGANLVVFDLETGGFKADNNPLVEVCFICYDTITKQEIGRYEALITPYYEHPVTKEPLVYTDGAMNAHGITIAKMEQEGKELSVVIKESLVFLKSCNIGGREGKPFIAGHNILKFDIPFFTVIADWFKQDWLALVNNMPLDTMHLARLVWPQTLKHTPDAKVKDHTLGTMCEALGVKLVNAHRASADTEANAEALLRWLEMMRGGLVESSANNNPGKSKPFNF